MRYNSIISKIYDSIFYFYEYYSLDRVRREFDYSDTEFMYYCFSQIRDKIELPELLRPLFSTGGVDTNAISEFFAENIDFEHDGIDDFIFKIMSNADDIYQKVINKIFEDYQKEKSKRIFPTAAPAGYLEAISTLKADDSFKLQVSLLIGNFNYAISLFTGLLKKVYSLVDALHSKHQKEIDREFERIQSEENLKLYKTELQLDIPADDRTEVSIALLNQYVFSEATRDENKICLLAGIRHEEAISGKSQAESTSLPAFLVACGNELRIKILYSIAQNGELTLSQLSKIHETAPATMVRHIEVLVSSDILQIARREGLQVFYKINRGLFRNIKHDIDEFIDIMQNPH